MLARYPPSPVPLVATFLLGAHFDMEYDLLEELDPLALLLPDKLSI